MTHSATSSSTIKYLRQSFAALSLPEVTVSDNAATFSSDECVQLKKKNGVKHIRLLHIIRHPMALQRELYRHSKKV